MEKLCAQNPLTSYFLEQRGRKTVSAGQFVSRLPIDMVKTHIRLVDERPYRPHFHVPQKWMCRDSHHATLLIKGNMQNSEIFETT